MDIPDRMRAPADVVVPAGTAPELTVSPLSRQSGLRAAGEVSLATRAIWERALDQAVREGEDVYYLELSAVTFVDVAGVGVLAEAARRLEPGRRIVLRRPPSTLHRIMDMFWPGLPGIEVSAS